MMAEKRVLVTRLLGCVLVLGVATFFTKGYNAVHLNILKYGAEIDRDVLPGLCNTIADFAFVGYILCALALAAGLFAIFRQKRAPLLYEISVQTAHLGAVILVLTSLAAWWLPHTYGVVPVK